MVCIQFRVVIENTPFYGSRRKRNFSYSHFSIAKIIFAKGTQCKEWSSKD
jgi:hypothetical protein